jgi:ParB/RepB/Spo0J family partition protein
MARTTQASNQSLLPAATEVAAVADPQRLLLERFHLKTLPAHETRELPLAQIQVPSGTSLLRSARGLVKSIERVGILQPPSVVLLPNAGEEVARYEVIAGRRRVLAAHLCTLPTIKCEVYEQCTPHLASFLALIENAQRSAAWIKEVADLRRLIDERVGMTLDDLAACGFERHALGERLKIARLPHPILDQILAGKLSLETARKIARLRENQQERLATIAQGETLTLDLVKQTLRQVVQADLTTPFQVPFTTLTPTWNETPGMPALSAPPPAAADRTLEHALQALQVLTASSAYQTLEQTTRLLTDTLIQKLTLAMRGQEKLPPAAPSLAS